MGKENRAAPIFIYGFPEVAQEEMGLSLKDIYLLERKKKKSWELTSPGSLLKHQAGLLCSLTGQLPFRLQEILETLLLSSQFLPSAVLHPRYP